MRNELLPNKVTIALFYYFVNGFTLGLVGLILGLEVKRFVWSRGEKGDP